MTKEQAQNVLYEQVFVPAFVEKLAELNIAPRTQADLVEMLKIAENLDVAERSGVVSNIESAAGADDFLKQASQSLETVIHSGQKPEATISEQAKAAAAVLAKQDADSATEEANA